MSEDLQTNGEATPAEAKTTEKTIPYERFKEVNDQLRDLKKEIDESKKQAKESQDARLKEQNDYKKLYEDLLLEVEPLRGASEKASRYEAAITERNSARIASIPEDKRLAIPEIDDPVKLERWLDNALPLLMEAPKPQAPKLDAGAGNGGSAANSATGLNANLQSVADIARQFGYQVDNDSVAQYARNPIKATEIKEQK
jgi:hypothetical protein